MPIEIRELLIRLTIEDNRKKSSMSNESLHELKSNIIKECTQKVLVKLNREKGR